MTGLYTKRFKKLSIRDIWPDPDDQDRLFNVIKAVKKGDTGTGVRDDYKKVCEHLLDKGAQTAIIACTELSALDSSLPINTVDAAQVLAMEIVKTKEGQ